MANFFSLLSKPIKKIIEEKGFSDPTETQIDAIPIILQGKNTLLIAPTGTGKTEAAFLPIFSKFIETPFKVQGIKILYITPLRSLNRDILDRLNWWCERLDIRVSVRHGDTEKRERFFQSKFPPDMLITTPETLQAILLGRNMKKHLSFLKWVIIDEAHEFAENKRGSQLVLGLERLRMIVKDDFQIIGLSATIGSPEKVAKFIVGTNRPIEIIKVSISRFMKLEIKCPQPTKEDYLLAEQLYTNPDVSARLRIMRDIIKNQRSVLLFTNTRSIAEILASRFRVWDIGFPISIHHGSLSKPARVMAETGLKKGDLKGLICTSSLELGIDIGSIDLCIQYMSPRQVTRLLQRVGRSGHKIGRVARGIIITMDSDDTLESLVIAKKAYEEDLETVKILEKPLDALTHQIVGLLIQEKRLNFDKILEIFRNAYPYKDLSESDLENVLNYLQTRFPRLAIVLPDEKLVVKPRNSKDMYEYYYSNLSMIPDEKNYLVIDETNETPVGILDEAFVAEYGDPGTKFIVRGSVWIVSSVYGDKIYVKPVDDPSGAIPSWVGEEIPVPFDIAQEVGKIRKVIVDNLKIGKNQKEIAFILSKKYPADESVIHNAIQEIVEQFQKGYPIPTDKIILIEQNKDFIILHSCFGSLLNRTLSTIIGHLISEDVGHIVSVQNDPYRIIILSSEYINTEIIKNILYKLAYTDLKPILMVAITKIGLFKRRMIHVARKFGAVAKWADFSNISIDQLLKVFRETPIFDEALSETMEKDMDEENLKIILEEIKEGSIKIDEIQVEVATPLAKIGIEKIEKKLDLIRPEKLKHVIIESTKARLLSEVRTFVCTTCWSSRTTIVKDFLKNINCPVCNSEKIGIISTSEEEVARICKKIGKKISKKDEIIINFLLESAHLVKLYGEVAIISSVGKNLGINEIKNILSKEPTISDNLFELIIEEEKKSLTKIF